MGEWAVNHDRKKTHVDIVDTSDARPRGLWSSVRQISNNTNGKTEKNNMITQRHSLGCLAWRPPGRSWYGASGGGPPVAVMGAWRTFTGYSEHKDVIGCNNINHKT